MNDSNTVGVVAFAATACLLACGCGKKKYPASCSKAVALTAPWTDLGFPADRGRVCESGPDSAKYMFLDTNVDDAKKPFEDAVLAKGYVKDRCTSLACDYKGTDDKITIQPFEASGKLDYVTISLRRYPVKRR